MPLLQSGQNLEIVRKLLSADLPHSGRSGRRMLGRTGDAGSAGLVADLAMLRAIVGHILSQLGHHDLPLIGVK
jgi:hypothetical protein